MCPRRDIHVLIFLGEHRCFPKTHHVPPGVHDGYYFPPTCGLGLYIVLFVSFIPLHYIAHCEFYVCRPQLTISFDVFLPSLALLTGRPAVRGLFVTFLPSRSLKWGFRMFFRCSFPNFGALGRRPTKPRHSIIDFGFFGLAS